MFWYDFTEQPIFLKNHYFGPRCVQCPKLCNLTAEMKRAFILEVISSYFIIAVVVHFLSTVLLNATFLFILKMLNAYMYDVSLFWHIW